ncbi:MAG: hypothetical protein Q7J80_03685 [Anaerolineales bacterium]|nr:hypothetical protein [Anaerolineales bacterium]
MQNLKVPIMLVLVLLAVFVVVSPAQASPIAGAGIGFDPQKESHVWGAVVLMYAPMPDNHSNWLDAVCKNMTEGGCGYFTDNLESMLWQRGHGVVSASALPVAVVATLDDGSQVWKAAVAIHKNCGVVVLKNCQFIESDIYLLVVYDQAQGKWLLNRVLYGPYIDFPQFEEQ